MITISARLSKALCAALLSLTVSACDVSVPSQLETGQMRLSEETRTLAVDANKPDAALARRIAGDFRDNGRGDLHILMPYKSGDPLHETQARRMIDYVGLPWDDACLEPHKNKRSVLTASKMQVIKPVYKTSVESWRAYEKHLGPLLDALGIT